MTHNETVRRAIHDIRLANAVWCPETGRFHPDVREHSAESQNGTLLTNVFQIGTALVASQDGTVLDAVVARNATRAAAAVAIRNMRAGGQPIHEWEVSMRNKSGESHSETVWFGFDYSPSHDETVGDERSDSVVEMSLNEIHSLFGRLDDTIDNLDVGGWQARNADPFIYQSHLETDRDED
jgi:hypothetical protein